MQLSEAHSRGRTEMLVEVSCCGGGSRSRTVWPGKTLVQTPLLLSTIIGIATDCKEVSDTHIAKRSAVIWVHALEAAFPLSPRERVLPPEGSSGGLNCPASRCPPEELFPAHRFRFRHSNYSSRLATGS